MASGALGAEIVLSGKLPAERAKSWRFAQGYLKKTGEPAKEVNRALSQAITIPGVVGIKVSILPPTAKIHDRIVIDEALKSRIRFVPVEEEKPKKAKKEKKPRKNPAKKAKSSKKSEANGEKE